MTEPKKLTMKESTGTSCFYAALGGFVSLFVFGFLFGPSLLFGPAPGAVGSGIHAALKWLFVAAEVITLALSLAAMLLAPEDERSSTAPH